MDKKFYFDFKTNQEVIKKIGFIDLFKGKWKAIQREENKYLKELRKIATIESIGSSTRIEGATLTNEEVAALIENMQINKLSNRDEQEAIGYYEVMEFILDDYDSIEVNQSNIFNLHNQLLRYSSKDSSHRGKYKELSNKVVATYPGGEQRVIFNTTEPFLVNKEMESLLNWYKDQIEQAEMHPLLAIGGFIYEFLSIHPFQDGNGRLSRLLTTLMLLQNDYDFIQFISFENQIENTKKEYYQALMDAQQHRGTKKEIITRWMIYFLGSLEVLIRKLDKKYEHFKQIGPYLNDRQKEVLSYIAKNEPTKVGDIASSLSAYSINTIKKDLQYLYQEGKIEKIGQGRGMTYIMMPKEEE